MNEPGWLVSRFDPLACEPTQLATPEFSSAHVKLSGTGRPCVNVAPSAAGLVNETVGPARSTTNVFDCTADVLPLKSIAIHFSVVFAPIWTGSGSSRGRFGFHSVDAVVGVEPSVV